MIIEEVRIKIKRAIATIERKEVYTAIIIILVGLASFGLGRLSNLVDNREPVKIRYENFESGGSKPVTLEVGEQGAAVAGIGDIGGSVVASKNGTKYYFPWCGGVSRISAANKVTFASKAEAEKAGYTPAANCKGL